MRGTFTYRNQIRAGIYLMLFFAGMFLGIAVVQMQDSTAFAGIFSEYFLSQYAVLRIDAGKLFGYVGRYRCGQYALLICCGALPNAPLVIGMLLFLLGMGWGSIISVSTLRLGLRGVLLCAAGAIPQIFFYLPAFGWVLLWVMKGGSSRRKYFLLATVGALFLLFGLVSEACLNPLILQQILRKM